jgi:hypothetical protein
MRSVLHPQFQIGSNLTLFLRVAIRVNIVGKIEQSSSLRQDWKVNMSSTYQLAQKAIADLKAAIYETLAHAPETGLSNAAVGRSLGIYTGHVGHEGHIPRTILSLMESEGVVQQNKETKQWTLKRHFDSDISID